MRNFHALSQCSEISDNQFSGKIPDFIQNWTNIGTLYALSFFLSLIFPEVTLFLYCLSLQKSSMVTLLLTESFKGVD